MGNKKRANLIKGTLVAGALLSVTALSAIPNSSSLFDYKVLGSGAEVRTEILNTDANGVNNFEAKCGEKAAKKGETDVKSAEAKCGEGKCGEGTCGEGDEKADATKTTLTKKEAKAAKKVKTKEAKKKTKEVNSVEKKGSVE